MLRTYLPCDRTHLTCLNDNATGKLITDPDALSDAAVSTWSKIWSKKKVSLHNIRNFLQAYDKSIPNSSQPPPPTINSIEEAIEATNNSVPGPDGIPPIFYRKLKHLFAPVLYRVFHHISTTQCVPRGFNNSLLYFLPKVPLPTVEQLRPINVPNVDNRIISSAIKSAILPCLNEFLSPRQHAFLSSRRMEHAIRSVNDQFYSARLKKLHKLFLFIDFRKAYDMISHAYIHALLKKVNSSATQSSVYLVT
jgi:hypothetical protein